MKVHQKIFFVSIFFFLIQKSFFSQSSRLEEAMYYFESKEFEKAYPIFDDLSYKNPKNIDFKLKLGICCLNLPEKKSRAIEIFEQIKKDTKSPDASYYLGKAYHINYKFEEAIAQLEEFLGSIKKAKKEDEEIINDAKRTITHCKNGIFIRNNNIRADIKNLGDPINSPDDEYVPSITTDEYMMFFTYRGEKSLGGKLNTELQPDPMGQYGEDIWVSYRIKDSAWTPPARLEGINTKGNDACISVSPDGSQLFIFKSDAKNEGDIYVSRLSGTSYSQPQKLNNNINSDKWEGSCSISADGKELYFASEREGGQGGRDIWMSRWENGDWGPAVNLGPTINTPYDDDAPFIHPDGITLFFSSKGHTSIGGYDIMYTIKKDGAWIEPRSMGIPLNTTEDDRYYVINSSGTRGYFSSNRSGSGGKGKHDIYTVTPGILGEKPVLALLKGVVYGNDKPIEAKLKIIRLKDNTEVFSITSNNTTGKYLISLSPGNIYRIEVTADGFDPVSEDIDIETLKEYLEKEKDFYLYPPGYAPTTPVVEKTEKPEKTSEPCNPGSIPDFTPLKGKSLNNPEVYRQLLEMAGNYCSSKIIFKVQIAAYRFPQNYKYDHLIEFGKPEIVEYPDGITRFTQRRFNTINEAEKFRQQVIAKGQTDAWIVAFVDGIRYTLEELILKDFFGKSIN
jgi:tetratricopeptide (TPR) repeat protein